MKRAFTGKYFCYFCLVIFLLTLLNPAMAGLSIKNTTNSESPITHHVNMSSMDDFHTQHHYSGTAKQDQSQSAEDCNGFCANCIFCGALISMPVTGNHVFGHSYPVSFILKAYPINTYPVFHPPKYQNS